MLAIEAGSFVSICWSCRVREVEPTEIEVGLERLREADMEWLPFRSWPFLISAADSSWCETCSELCSLSAAIQHAQLSRQAAPYEQKVNPPNFDRARLAFASAALARLLSSSRSCRRSSSSVTRAASPEASLAVAAEAFFSWRAFSRRMTLRSSSSVMSSCLFDASDASRFAFARSAR